MFQVKFNTNILKLNIYYTVSSTLWAREIIELCPKSAKFENISVNARTVINRCDNSTKEGSSISLTGCVLAQLRWKSLSENVEYGIKLQY